jgi:hypothetical protein
VFAAIQGMERNQDLANLAPKGCFISAEAAGSPVGMRLGAAAVSFGRAYDDGSRLKLRESVHPKDA